MKRSSAILFIAAAITFFVCCLLPLSAWSAGESKAEVLLERGLMAYDAKKYDQAIGIWTEAISLDPSQHKVYFNRGMAWFRMGKTDKALSDFTRAVEVNPRYAAAYTSRGFLWNKLGEYEKAKSDFVAALTANPDIPDPYYQLARIYALCPEDKYRDGEQAVMWALKTQELRDDPQSTMLLAAAYAEDGNFRAARSTQEQAIAWLQRENMVYEVDNARAQLARYQENRPLVESSVVEEEVAESSEAASTPVESGYTKEPAKPVVAETPPTKPAPAPAPAKDGTYYGRAYPYVIQVSSYRDNEKAIETAQDLRKKGDKAFTAHTIIPDKGAWTRVFVGYYPDLVTTKDAAAALKARRFTYSLVRKKPWTISVGDYVNEQAISNMEAALLAKGYLAYRIDGLGDSATRLAIGAYDTAKEAHKMSVDIQDDGFPVEVVKR